MLKPVSGYYIKKCLHLPNVAHPWIFQVRNSLGQTLRGPGLGAAPAAANL
jgi:hypothetical protein